jgi:hypothetical protein
MSQVEAGRPRIVGDPGAKKIFEAALLVGIKFVRTILVNFHPQ